MRLIRMEFWHSKPCICNARRKFYVMHGSGKSASFHRSALSPAGPHEFAKTFDESHERYPVLLDARPTESPFSTLFRWWWLLWFASFRYIYYVKFVVGTCFHNLLFFCEFVAAALICRFSIEKKGKLLRNVRQRFLNTCCDKVYEFSSIARRRWWFFPPLFRSQNARWIFLWKYKFFTAQNRRTINEIKQEKKIWTK